MLNVGSLDRVIRVVIGVALLALWFVLEGNLRYLGFVGLVPLGTAAVGFCPLYRLLGLKTTGAKAQAGVAGKAA